MHPLVLHGNTELTSQPDVQPKGNITCLKGLCPPHPYLEFALWTEDPAVFPCLGKELGRPQHFLQVMNELAHPSVNALDFKTAYILSNDEPTPSK